MRWQIDRLARGVTQQRHQSHGLARAVDAAIRPGERVERARVGHAVDAAIGQVERGGGEIERDQVAADLTMQALRRLRPGAAQQRRREFRDPVFVRCRLGKDVVVVGEQAEGHAFAGLGVGEAADLDGQPVRAAPHGGREVGADQGLDGAGFGIGRSIAGRREQQVDAWLVEHIRERQHGVSELIGLPFGDGNGAFPDDLAVLHLPFERVALHRLTKRVVARERDDVPLGHAQHLQLDGRQIDAGERQARRLVARQQE